MANEAAACVTAAAIPAAVAAAATGTAAAAIAVAAAIAREGCTPRRHSPHCVLHDDCVV